MGLFLLQKVTKRGKVFHMKKIVLFFLLVLLGCAPIKAPDSFTYKELETPEFTLASWQKITNSTAPIRIYIEGDGHAFNHNGQPTSNPTPKSDFMRQLAFNDPNPNVVYLARPCQYVEDDRCFPSDWTTGRFSKAVLDSMGKAIKQIAGDRRVVLIGYSGGALVSGMIINRNPDINVIKWLTIAGVLNHATWTTNLRLKPLVDSLDLKNLPNVPQLHLVGEKDRVVPPSITQQLVPGSMIIVVPGADHAAGYERYLPTIYQ